MDFWDLLNIMGLGIPNLFGGSENIVNGLTGRTQSDRATQQMLEAIQKQIEETQRAKKESMGFLEPYLKNAPQDYDRYRGMVQSGHFSQGAPTSFNPQSFSFDPSQGSASFQTNSFSPLAIPQYQPPPQTLQQAPMGAPVGNTMPQSVGIGGPFNQVPQGNEIAQMGQQVGIGTGHVSGMTLDPNSQIPQVGPNPWAGIPGTGIGMPAKTAMFLKMLGIDQFGQRMPWTPWGEGRPNASGPTVPVGPRGGPTLPGQQFGGRSYTPSRPSGGRGY